MASAHHIQDEAAYEAAIKRRIQANARKGRAARWLAADPSRAALCDRIFNERGVFFAKMQTALDEWGSLTDGQEAAVRRIFAGNAAQEAARKDSTRFVGEIGQRRDFVLTITKHAGYESAFGYQFITIMQDADGNTFLHKGAAALGNDPATGKPMALGASIKVRATIKAHERHKGTAQTILSRPTVAA